MRFFATKLSENMAETPEGFLLCLAVAIARTGEQEYNAEEIPLLEADDDGIIRITRDEEEVFRSEAIASFEGKPFTIKHPEEFVDPENWSELAKGHIQNVRRGEGDDKDNLIADILITDSYAISLVKSGLRGLSCGYEAEYTQTGEGRGTQTNIVGNHLALVEEGRAGASYAINDQKGAKMSKKKTLMESIKAHFKKTQDEALKMIETIDEDPEKKPDDKKTEDGTGYDELMKAVKDLGEMVKGMKKSDDEDPEKKKSGDDDKEKDADPMADIAARLDVLEKAVAKLMEGEVGEDEEEKKEKSDDEDDEEKEVGDEDEDKETADTMDSAVIARAEILAPGIKKTKDVKVASLKIAYATKDGKKAIDALTGGREPDYKSEARVALIFAGAAEILKKSRSSSLAKTFDFQSAIFDEDTGRMTPDKMNEINAKRYKQV